MRNKLNKGIICLHVKSRRVALNNYCSYPQTMGRRKRSTLASIDNLRKSKDENLEERGFQNMAKVHAECKGFKCVPGATSCCCHRILYNQPDFANVPSILELACKALGVLVIFLPKFHCELNFIEQCWGFAKRIYRLNPESSWEDHLEKNALDALEAVPLTSMHKFTTWSCRFMDAYEQGLNSRQAAWAARKYWGHRVLPVSIMDDLEKAGIV